MSYQVQIGTDVITLPSTGADAVWSPGQIQFNQAVAAVLQNIASPFDIVNSQAPLSQSETLSLGSFQSGLVRGFTFTYNIYREYNSGGVNALAESGVVNGVFRDDTTTWELQHEFSGPRRTTVGQEGTQYHTFSMSGDEIVITALPPPGTYISGQIAYSASTELVNP